MFELIFAIIVFSFLISTLLITFTYALINRRRVESAEFEAKLKSKIGNLQSKTK